MKHKLLRLVLIACLSILDFVSSAQNISNIKCSMTSVEMLIKMMQFANNGIMPKDIKVGEYVSCNCLRLDI